MSAVSVDAVKEHASSPLLFQLFMYSGALLEIPQDPLLVDAQTFNRLALIVPYCNPTRQAVREVIYKTATLFHSPRVVLVGSTDRDHEILPPDCGPLVTHATTD